MPTEMLTEEGIYIPHSSEPIRMIDYIFTFRKKLAVSEFSVHTDQRAKTTSDHCPLVAKFLI